MQTFDEGKKINDFDKEISFILRSKNNNSLLSLHSIGKNKLRAGEIDLWFEGGRLCLLNNGKSLYFWPRLNTKSSLETHDSLRDIPKIYSTNNDKSQYFVIDSIKYL